MKESGEMFRDALLEELTCIKNKILQRESKLMRRGRYKKEWWLEVSLSKTDLRLD